MRAKIKAMNYGLAYGLSAFGLGQQLGIEPGEARGLMDEYFETFGGIRDYLGGVVDEARKTGFTETIWGRRRYLPDLTSDNRQRREMAERMALNAPIQGSAADLIKVAMLHVAAGHRATAGLRSRMLLQVHDELVFEVAEGEREALESLVRDQMGGAADLTGPARRLGRHRPQLARGRSLSAARAPLRDPARRVRLEPRDQADRQQDGQQHRVDGDHGDDQLVQRGDHGRRDGRVPPRPRRTRIADRPPWRASTA